MNCWLAVASQGAGKITVAQILKTRSVEVLPVMKTSLESHTVILVPMTSPDFGVAVQRGAGKIKLKVVFLAYF